MRAAARRHRPRVELVPARRLHLHRARGGSARTRSTSRCASARARRDRRAAARSRWSARSRRSSCTRTSAARPAIDAHPRRSPRRRSATRATRPSSCGARKQRSGLEIEVLTREAGGPLRLPGGGQLDDARRRRRARPRRRLDAAHARARTATRRDARSWPLGAVRMTERFLQRRARQEQADQGAARARGGRARGRAVARRGRPAGRHRRHGPQPRGGRAARRRAAVLRRPGLPDHARRARRADRRRSRR